MWNQIFSIISYSLFGIVVGILGIFLIHENTTGTTSYILYVCNVVIDSILVFWLFHFNPANKQKIDDNVENFKRDKKLNKAFRELNILDLKQKINDFNNDPETFQTRRNWGLIASIAFFIGAFLPLVKTPVNTLTFMDSLGSVGASIIALTIISASLSLSGNFYYLRFSGMVSLGVIIYKFSKVNGRIHELEEKLRSQDIENMSTVLFQYRYGWAVLIVSAAILCILGYCRLSGKNTQEPVSN